MPVLEVLVNESRPVILVTVETHVTSEVNSGEIELPGYQTLRSNSNSSHSAGVVVYVDDETKCDVVTDIVYDFNNILIFDIHNGPFRGRWLSLYHSPNNSDNVFIDRLDNACESHLNNCGTVFSVGDFNINCHHTNRVNTYKNRLIRVMSFYGLKLRVNKYTRVTSSSKTMIDLLFTNSTNVSVEVSDNDSVADHKNIIVKKQSTSSKKIKKTVIDRSKYSCEALNRKILSHGQYSSLLNCSQLDQKTKLFQSIVKQSVNELVSVKEIIVNYSNRWYKDQLKSLRLHKNNLNLTAQLLDTETDWSNFRVARNKFTNEMTKARNQDNKEVVEKLKSDPKKLWRHLKKFNKEPDSKISEIVVGNRVIHDPTEMVEELNEYFVKSVTDLNQSIPSRPFTDTVCNFSVFSEFQLLDENSLRNVMKKIVKKSGIDNVNIDVLNHAMSTLGNQFLSIVNESLNTGHCPIQWRKTIVTPIQKVPKAKKVEELRAVNTIPIDDKVMQCIVRDQLQSHIDSNNIISDYQSAYRSHYSCETAINYIIADWKGELESGNIIVAVFIDLKRAFETIDRFIMLQVLDNVGVKGNVLSWFRSWLSQRTQHTKLNGKVSSEIDVNVGLPQGTPLSCILFALYINAIVSIIKHCKIKLFADDTLIWIIAKNKDDLIQKIFLLNEDLARVCMFFEVRKMFLNVSKTKFMIISGSSIQHVPIPVKLNGQSIERVWEMKYLGVIIDPQLKLDLNHQYVKKKMIKKISFLQRNRNRYYMHTKLLMYKSLIGPHVDFCSTVLFLATDTQLKELQVLQNRAMRAILNCGIRTSIETMLNRLKLLDVKQRIYFNVLIAVHKMKLGLLPPYLTQQLRYVGDVQPYGLRSNNRFRLPDYTGQGQNSLFYKGVDLYNKMMRDEDDLAGLNIESFKRKLVIYVKDRFSSH